MISDNSFHIKNLFPSIPSIETINSIETENHTNPIKRNDILIVLEFV